MIKMTAVAVKLVRWYLHQLLLLAGMLVQFKHLHNVVVQGLLTVSSSSIEVVEVAAIRSNDPMMYQSSLHHQPITVNLAIDNRIVSPPLVTHHVLVVATTITALLLPTSITNSTTHMKFHRVIVAQCHYRSVHNPYQAAVRVVDPLVVASLPRLLLQVIPPPTVVISLAVQTTMVIMKNMYVVYNTTMDTTQDRLI